MMLRPLVFGVGLPRTGTTSIRMAMGALGYHIHQDGHADAIVQGAVDGNLEPIRERVRAWRRELPSSDRPQYFSEPAYGYEPADLVEAFPGAGFILSTRVFQPWRDSVIRFYLSRAQRPGQRGHDNGSTLLLLSMARGDELPDLWECWLEHERKWSEACRELPPDRFKIVDPERDTSDHAWRLLHAVTILRGPFPHENKGGR